METKIRKEDGISRILIVVFCGLIAIITSVVLFGFYQPNQNALRAFCSVSMDVICIILLLVLLISFAFENYGTNRTARLFEGLLAATIWAVFLDFLNWAFDGSLALGQITFWFTVGSLCMGSILACIFSLYLYSYMKENHGLDKMGISIRVCVIMNLISFVITLVLALTGTAFKFVDGHYELGALYDITTILPVLTLLYVTGYSIRWVKKIGAHDVIAVVGYIVFMIAGAVIEAVYAIGATYVSVAIANILIFVMLQNGVIAKEKRNVQKWMRKSNTDELTGFYNRYAYEEEVARLEESEIRKDFVYVSIDVNSLKVVNDTLGHSAGDELLLGAVDCLKQSFSSYGNLYRIGGDEFIAIIYADENRLEKIKQNLEDAIRRWRGKKVSGLSFSCGYVTKRENPELSVRKMAILADERMYEAKKEYYRKAGIDRRRK